jgi:hypothetical protein
MGLMGLGTEISPASQLRVTVNGHDTESNEHHAAEEFGRVIEGASLPSDNGTISIHSNVILFGQPRPDIDILVLANFPRGFRRMVRLPGKNAAEEVGFFNFVATIEVKDLETRDIKFENLAASVRYRGEWHSVTSQSEGQKFSVKSFFTEELGWAPWVYNFIWFRNLAKNDLPSFRNNYLAADSTFDDFLEKLCGIAAPRVPYFHANDTPQWRFYSTKVQNAAELMARQYQMVNLLTENKNKAGALTRSKLEKLTHKTLLKNQIYAQSIGERLVLIRGRAGTGKTVKLLHIAYDLCANRGQRVLILTYNRMLVSDLQRLIVLAGVRSDLDSSTVEVTTIHSYVFGLLEHFGIEKQDFIKRYEELKATLLQYLRQGVINEGDIDQFKKARRTQTNWDTVLIDEGQDWPDDEREILFQLFAPKNIVVASGTGQFVRSITAADWTRDVEFYKPPAEKRSLRQKRNLCEFQRMYAEHFGINWDLEPSTELTGGKVVIVKGRYSKEIHERIYAQCKRDGNGAYEYLFLVPPLMTRKEGNEKVFSLADEFDSWGIKTWDGVNRDNRTQYPTDVDEHRVIPYESARGLEGWVVASLALDSFVDYKHNFPYIIDAAMADAKGQLALGMQSQQERVHELVHEWVLIALTRAIDTAIITLENPSSAYSRKLLAVAYRCPDFVEIIDAPHTSATISPTRAVNVEGAPPVPKTAEVGASTLSNPVTAVPTSRFRDFSAPRLAQMEEKSCPMGATSSVSPPSQLTPPAVPEKVWEPQPSAAPTAAESSTPNALRDFTIDCVPDWVVGFVFRRLAENNREFSIQVTHKDEYVANFKSRSECPGWRNAISTLVRSGFIEVVERTHARRIAASGNEYPRAAELFRYRITEQGVAEAEEWAKQYRKRQEKRERKAQRRGKQ